MIVSIKNKTQTNLSVMWKMLLELIKTWGKNQPTKSYKPPVRPPVSETAGIDIQVPFAYKEEKKKKPTLDEPPVAEPPKAPEVLPHDAKKEGKDKKTTAPTPKAEPMEETTKIWITKAKLKEIMPYVSQTNLDKYFKPLNATLDSHKITTNLRIAHFIAQVAHESGSFRYSKEIWKNPKLNAKKIATRGSRFQLKYEGNTKLGNTQPGDGYKFRGRGLIQLTGRTNYVKFGESLDKNFTEGDNPDLVASAKYAVEVAGWYWSRKKLNALADKDDVIKITKLINGGLNGIDDRKKYLKKAKKALGIKE